jgi:hypothetical protein
VTVRELLAKARKCETCGKEHKPWRSKGRPALAPQWSAPDGHPYRSRLPLGVIAQIERLAA